MKKYLPLIFFTILTNSLINQANAINETENNNHLHNANLTYEDSIMTGVHNSANDTSDYFITVPKNDGTFKFKIDYSCSGNGTPDLYIYIYNKNGSQIGSKFIYNVDTVANHDSINVYCRLQDTLYIRIHTSQTFAYSFSYSTQVSGQIDNEPNNDLPSAQLVMANDTIRGRVGYSSVQTDANDYFVTVLPIYGTMKYYVWRNNTSNSTSADFYSYIYNKNGSQIGANFQYNVSLGESIDTINVYCREQDTVYMRINTNGCFSYKIYYEVDAPATNDIEPNNSLPTAQLINANTNIGGRAGYTSVQTDANDYFVTALPTFGTIKYYIEYNNTSNTTAADFYSYIYNKNGSQIESSFNYNVPLGISYDTISVYCRELDTVYFRINTNGCFSYTFNYEVIAPTTNDAEPNNTLAQAAPFLPNDTLGGRIGYVSVSADANDYFWTLLPEDGAIKYFVEYNNISNSAGSDFYSYIYNKNGSQIGSSFKYNQPLGLFTDSITINCRAKDTVYFRINSTGCFSYRIYYKMVVPTPTDDANNDDFAHAQSVSFADTTFGRVGYSSINTDANDYFVTVLPDDGTLQYIVEYTNTSHSASSDYYTYIYNKNGSQIGSSFNYNQPDSNFIDTINVYCRLADTVYFRTNSNGCFSYRFYQNVLTSGQADVEPNNNSALAALIDLNTPLKGRSGYGSVQVDDNDYYKFYLPTYSNITSQLTYHNTSNTSASDFYIYLYNSNGSQVFSDFNYNQATGINQDTLHMNCLAPDTFYLRVNTNGCFSYEMNFEISDQQPIAKIVASQLGHEVGFTAKTKNADSHNWNFDDGTTSTFKYPKKDFAIGTYNVVLEAKNSGCNLTHRDTFFVEIKGIEKYEPNFAGAGGDAVIHIYGGGLDTATKVWLSLGGKTLVPLEKYTNNKKNMLSATFDFHFADAGAYDLTIEIPGEPAVTFAKGFRIDDFEYPYTAADIIGPTRWRINRDTRFSLAISNRGNVTASGVLVNLAFPKSVAIKFEHNQIRQDSTSSTTISTPDTTVTLANAEGFSIYHDLDPFTPIDSFQGVPYDGYYVRLMIPHIPANSTFELPFLAKTSQTGNPEFIVSTQKPNFYGSCGTPNYTQMGDNVASELIDAVDLYADNSKNVPLKVFTVGTKIGKEHLALSARKAGDHFWAWWDGYEVQPETYMMRDQELTKANDYMVKTATTEGLKLVAGKGQKYLNGKYAERVDFINKRLANNPKMSAALNGKYLDKLNNLTATNQRLNAMFKNSSDGVALYEKLNKLYAEVEDCPELKKQLEDLINELDKELTPREQKKKKSQSVVSMDPNAIYGPQGVDAANWINTMDLITYMVTFENVDTALADAQIVTVYDTLNPAVFDLSSFRFGAIHIGNRALRIPTARQEFVYDMDLRPAKNIIVRVLGSLDTLSGLITWSFVSLDPTTMELPVFEGFLPPNVNAPEGEGTMTYSVRMKDNLPNQTQVNNIAVIYFDDNLPINTNIWSNSIDKGLPISGMTATLKDTVVKIKFNATDAESGVDVNYLYVQSKGNPDWIPLTSSPHDTLTFIGTPGETYHFYSLAIDKLGQKENKAPQVEVTVTVPGLESDFNPSFNLYPNPMGGQQLFVKSNGNFPATTVNIYDMMGRALFSTKTDFFYKTDTPIYLNDFSSGAYLVYFKTKSGKTTVEKLVVIGNQ